MKFLKLGVYSTLIYGKGTPSRFRQRGSMLAIFSVSQFWYMFEFEICKRGGPSWF